MQHLSTGRPSDLLPVSPGVLGLVIVDLLHVLDQSLRGSPGLGALEQFSSTSAGRDGRHLLGRLVRLGLGLLGESEGSAHVSLAIISSL